MSSSEINTRVGIAGNALVVSFLTADAPRVWRADMGQLLNAGLEVQNNQGKYTLVMKRSGAPAEEIATFTGKEQAVGALQMITEALLGQDALSTPQKKSGWPKKILKLLLRAIAGFCVFIVLLNILMSFAGRHAQSSDTKIPAAQTGVPAPADDILGK